MYTERGGASGLNARNGALIQKFRGMIFDTALCNVSKVTEYQYFRLLGLLCYKITEISDEIKTDEGG